jgi:hypothetical protein
MRITRVAKLMGACLWMGMGALAAGMAYTAAYEKITGKPIDEK